MKNYYNRGSAPPSAITRHMRSRFSFLRTLMLALSMLTIGWAAQAQTTYTIGTGTVTTYQWPVNSLYNYSYGQSIYPAASLTGQGMVSGMVISKIRYFVNSSSTGTPATNNDWTVYMGNTTQANFPTTASWIGTGSLTQVFTGTITWSSGSWVEITLTTPFTWTGSNLVVAVDENAANYSYPVYFNYTAGAANSSISYYSDGTNPNPATPPTANTRNTYLPNIQLVASNPCPTTPTVTASVSSPVCPGDDINLTCTTSSDPLTSTYLWSGPDGFSSTDQNPTISGATAAKAGVYTVVVTEPVNGCTATAFTSSLVVKTAPTIDAVSATPSLICPGATTTLNVYPLSPTLSYCNSNFTNATYEFVTNVSFDAINNTSGANTGGPVNYTAQVANVTAGAPTTLSVTIDPDALEYVYAWIDWNQNGVLNDAGEAYTLAVSTSLAGPHTLAITPPMTAINGNTRMRVMVDYYNSTPNPCRSASYGEAEDYTVNVSGGVDPFTYSWSDGMGVVGTSASITQNPTANTTYAATVTNDVGCSTTSSVAVAVYTPPTVAISSTPASGIVCVGSSATLTASGASTYAWSPADDLDVTTGATVVSTPTINRTYTVTGTDANGCENTATFNVVADSFHATVTAGSTTFCLGDSTTLTASTDLPPGPSTLPSGYCTPTSFGGLSGDYINNFSFNTIVNNGSGDGPGDFVDYSGTMSTTVTAGSSYAISMQSGFWGQGFNVWIDYNRDGVFDTSESVYNTGSASTGVFSGTITIPGSASLGTTKMRVGCLYAGVPASTEACEHTGYGEYEDYAVNILGDVTTYAWSGAAGLSGTSGSSVTATPTATGANTYYLTATNANGCTAMDSVTLNVNATPVATASNDGPTCAGTDVNLDGSADITGSTFSWTGPNSFAATTEDAVVTGVTTNSGTYTLVATSPAGCASAPATTAVVINAAPVISSVDATPDVICAGESTTLSVVEPATATYCAASTTYGCGIDYVSNVTFGSINRSSSCDGSYNNFPTSTATTTVTAGGTEALSVTTGGDTEGAAVWIDWNQDGDFDDAGEAVLSGYLGTEPATYTATVNVPLSALNGETRMRVRCSYYETPSSACGNTTYGYGETEDYTITVTGGASANTYSWDDGSGVVATTSSFTANPAATTTYTVTVTNGFGCSSTGSKTVTVNALPAITTQPADQTVCEGTALNLSITTDATNIQWLQDGSAISGANTATYSVAAAVATDAGSYTVALSNAAGCVDTSDAATVVVNATPNISVLGTDNTSCSSPDGSLTITSSPALTSGDSYDVSHDGGGWLAVVVNGAGELVISGLNAGSYNNLSITNLATSCVSNTVSAAVVGGTVATDDITPVTSNDSHSQPSGVIDYRNTSCELIATIDATNGDLGTVTTDVTVMGAYGTFNSEFYFGRTFDFTATNNVGGNVTLYFSDAEVADYNAGVGTSNPEFPEVLPDGSNIMITAFHSVPGSGNGPLNYDTATAELITPTVTHNPLGYYEVNFNVSGFSGFFANTKNTVPLPITMGDIKATNIGAANRVDWNTKKEEAGDRFVIERSADARNFTAIGTTDAKGISDSRYSFIDAEPYMGINYYRLLVLNNNGSQYYTKVVNATVKGQGLQLEAFPNPVREVLTVRVNGKVTGNGEVSLLDASGRTIAKASIEANGTATFNMQHLAQGMYLVKFTDDVTTQTLKVTKD